ncbi:MAG TPA: hypothetical protein VEA40_12695 [Ramlibacter sp.]|nr:hypothetical protein [Ramlibacter sp.]
MNFARAAVALLAALAAGQALACYTVYDRGNRVLYRAQTPPVDMSRPLSETLQAAYPGGHLVFGQEADCPRINDAPLPQMPMVSANGKSPLLTDRATASKLGLPHTVLPSGIALVRERPDDMRPGITLADSGLPPAAAPDTRMMGAGPARPPQQQQRELVITEMHTPPLTAVQPMPMQQRR